MNPMAKERLGYPTQKPEDLLEAIEKYHLIQWMLFQTLCVANQRNMILFTNRYKWTEPNVGFCKVIG